VCIATPKRKNIIKNISELSWVKRSCSANLPSCGAPSLFCILMRVSSKSIHRQRRKAKVLLGVRQNGDQAPVYLKKWVAPGNLVTEVNLKLPERLEMKLKM